MRIALGQINTTVGDFTGNVDRMIQYARRAAELKADVIAFPELSITGYPPMDLLERRSFIERSECEMQRLAGATADLPLAIICGYAATANAATGKQISNSAAVLKGGELLLKQDKMLLPTYDVFDESRYFTPGDSERLVEIAHKPVAVTVCEDAWNDKQYWERRLYRRDPVEELTAAGGQVLISINASPYSMGKRKLRREIFTTTARRHGIPVAYVNQVGGQDQLVFDGSSFILDANGTVMASAPSFQEDLIFCDLSTGIGDQRENVPDPVEAVYEALVLGTRDYIHKCGFKKVIIGLSGGIDSSLTAAIAVDAVGQENVTGVSMPGPYSSDHSRSDAKVMAEALGIRYEVVPIGSMYDDFLRVLDPVFGELPRDVTEENIQARLRGVTLMALSNKWGAMVLTTGNKSELAVGYCTLYGDMCGGLAVISDVPKTLVYRLCRVANERHEGAIPENVFIKPPSAELRADQKDSDSLPEYDVLDRILREYVEDNDSIKEIAAELNVPMELVQDIARKVDRNEYKRQQAAPGLKVTTKAFGIGRRFPIAQRFLE